MRKKTFNSKLNIKNKMISSFQKILLEHKKKRPTLKCYNLKENKHKTLEAKDDKNRAINYYLETKK